jgi:hypothetical protein
MASYAELNPIIDGLLAKGGISAMRSQDLFDRALADERRIQEWLDALGMELVIDKTAGFAIARNRRAEDLEAQAEELGVARIEPVIARRHLKHWHSVVLVLLKTSLDREKRGEGREEWLPEDDLIDQAKVYFPPEHLEDEAGVVKQIRQILESFAGANVAPLAMKRTQTGKTFWRGTPWLDLAITVDEVRDYQRRMLVVVMESFEARGEDVPEAISQAMDALAA